MTENKVLNVYFGVPGSGKSTFAAYLARRCLRHKVPVYSNFPIIGALKYSVSDLGVFDISNCKLILDEAGLEFNNRDFKSFPRPALEFFKLHRHYNVSIDVFSQSYDDMDKKIRSLARNLFVVRRSRIPFFVTVVPIRRRVGIDDYTHQICDYYSFDNFIISLFTRRRVFMPFYWKFFDSYKRPNLPFKEFSAYVKK